jgi:hypothetical protein
MVKSSLIAIEGGFDETDAFTLIDEKRMKSSFISINFNVHLHVEGA